MDFLKTRMLVKASGIIEPVDACEHLGSMKIRTMTSWVTIPDAKHLKNVFAILEIDTRNLGKGVSTPGVKRPDPTPEEEAELGPEEASK